MKLKYLNYEYINDTLVDRNTGLAVDITECFNGIPQCRIENKDTFEHVVNHDLRKLFPLYSDFLLGNSEIVFQNRNRFLDYKNKKLLIVGGGPTTNQCEWENLDVDYIWSCNHFYEHPVLKRTKVDLAFIGQEVNLHNPEFQKYVLDNDTLLAFELAGKFYQNVPGTRTDVPNVPIENHMCCFTRYYGWIGANWRQMILALFLGFKEIYFIGMDGYTFEEDVRNSKHSFEPNKIPQGGPTKPGAKEAFRVHLIVFWNYVLNQLKPDIKFYNLGEFSNQNMTSHISKVHFPLTDEIKKKIGVSY